MNIFSLTGIISLRKVNSYGRFQDTKTKGNNNYYKLFKAIKNGVVENEDQAQAYLGIENKTTFLRFKGRYIRKILIHLESSKGMAFQGSLLEHEVYLLFTKAKALSDLGDSANAVELFKEVHKSSIQLGYIDIALSAAKNLRRIFAYVIINRKKYLHYEALTIIYKKQSDDYQHLIEIYDKVSHYFFTKKTNLEFTDLALVTLSKLESFEYTNQVHRFKIRYFELLIFLYTYFDNFEEATIIADQAISYIKDYSHFRRIDKYIILLEVIKLNIKKKDFNTALELLEELKCLRTKKKIDHRLVRIYGLEFMIFANLKKYDMLEKLSSEVFKDGEIVKFQALYQSWKIREAYCHLLQLMGKISPEMMMKYPQKTFRINRFINDTELYNKDKRGLNIAIILVPLIYYLIKGKYRKIETRIDSLRQYSFRYLRKDETLRSNCFIKMILKLPEAEYHPARTARYVKKYKKVLQENPAILTTNRTDTEIIPYEDLWGFIEEIMLKNISK